MDRCAVFVDAGYLYAEGARLCCGTRSRSDVTLDAAPVIGLLTEHATAETGVPVLRTYWYDGARNGIRTSEQHAIGMLADVKLRLGRINGQGQQKGVDALIYRDLITLAQQRAISDAVLLSGDEDLREGVRAAQDLGVRVVLVGIDCPGRRNQSEELVLEADRLHTLGADRLAPFFHRRPEPPAEPAAAGPPLRVAADAAARHAQEWLAGATVEERRALLDGRPVIPRELDGELLTAVEAAIGTTIRAHEGLRRRAREVFWGVVGGAATVPPG